MQMSKWALLFSAATIAACQGVGARETPANNPASTPVEQSSSAAQPAAGSTPAAPTTTTQGTGPSGTGAVSQVERPMLTQQEFQQCVPRLQERARSEGISAGTVNNVLANVQMTPKVLELDRRQPEFTDTFANYIKLRVNEQRINKGRELYSKHRELLEKIADEYGVPPQYLLSFWGLETNYGSFFGNMPVLDSLATLACDTRRSEFFTVELLNGLRIVDKGDVQPNKMVGSWAGAMGHTQFMPSTFLRYAIDSDGDGKRDIWGSLPDALTSAANFLKGIGWKPGTRWGREVRLPQGFAYEQAGLDKPKPLSDWAKQGVASADGSPLPVADEQAALLIPSGHRGPAFLVYENFNVIMRWNRSESYAISVGYLADRIVGAGPWVQMPPEDALRLSRAQVSELQTRLAQEGFESGTPDGVMGPATRGAIRGFQQARGMIADGFPDRSLFEALGIRL